MTKPPSHLTVVLSAGALWYSLVLGRALTREPFVDEAWYALPAWNLAENHSIGTPVLETVGSPMPGMKISLQGLREHTYWVMPLPTVLLAGWYRLAGFSLLTTRLFTTLWMTALLAAWYFILKQISGDTRLTALGLLFIATDSFMLSRAALGRMDIMSAALAFAGIASYLNLRERRLSAAIFSAQALVVLAGLSHPNGGIIGFCGLLSLVWLLDSRNIRWRHAGIAALPCVAALVGMGFYILQDPGAFAAQFFSQSAGRLDGIFSPLLTFRREIGRYAEVFGFEPRAATVERVKAVILGAYAFLAFQVCRDRAARTRYRCLLLLAAVSMVALALFENFKVSHYLVYVLPPFVALAAAGICSAAVRHRRLAAWAAAALICLQVGGCIRLILFRNSYHEDYVPALSWIRANAVPGSRIVADSALFFDLGTSQLVDDIRLGYLTGKKPDLIMVNQRYLDSLGNLRLTEPDAWRYIDNYLRNACRLVSVTRNYTGYVCAHARRL